MSFNDIAYHQLQLWTGIHDWITRGQTYQVSNSTYWKINVCEEYIQYIQNYWVDSGQKSHILSNLFKHHSLQNARPIPM